MSSWSIVCPTLQCPGIWWFRQLPMTHHTWRCSRLSSEPLTLLLWAGGPSRTVHRVERLGFPSVCNLWYNPVGKGVFGHFLGRHWRGAVLLLGQQSPRAAKAPEQVQGWVCAGFAHVFHILWGGKKAPMEMTFSERRCWEQRPIDDWFLGTDKLEPLRKSNTPLWTYILKWTNLGNSLLSSTWVQCQAGQVGTLLQGRAVPAWPTGLGASGRARPCLWCSAGIPNCSSCCLAKVFTLSVHRWNLQISPLSPE